MSLLTLTQNNSNAVDIENKVRFSIFCPSTISDDFQKKVSANLKHLTAEFQMIPLRGAGRFKKVIFPDLGDINTSVEREEDRIDFILHQKYVKNMVLLFQRFGHTDAVVGYDIVPLDRPRFRANGMHISNHAKLVVICQAHFAKTLRALLAACGGSVIADYAFCSFTAPIGSTAVSVGTLIPEKHIVEIMELFNGLKHSPWILSSSISRRYEPIRSRL